ncbi:MAG: class I SAM-dependent methyltransferase [FCB group bacterium]|nr:class I SAM-dependent methyltransferase [FCB group bacterium]
MNYDKIYNETKKYFGLRPEGILVDCYRYLNPSFPVLDIGAGQGRNTLFLARQGLDVEAIEPSKIACQQIMSQVKDKNLPIKVFNTGFENFRPSVKSYSGILIFSIIQILSLPKISSLIDKLSQWTEKGGLVFVTAFTTEDPALEKLDRKAVKIGKNSYRFNNDIHTFLEPQELKKLLKKDFSPLYYCERMTPWHRHGHRKEHRHALVEAIFRRKD